MLWLFYILLLLLFLLLRLLTVSAQFGEPNYSCSCDACVIDGLGCYLARLLDFIACPFLMHFVFSHFVYFVEIVLVEPIPNVAVGFRIVLALLHLARKVGDLSQENLLRSSLPVLHAPPASSPSSRTASCGT